MMQLLLLTLATVYQLNNKACSYLSDKFASAPVSLIEQFIAHSSTIHLTPLSEQKLSHLNAQDALISAPDTHKLLFETPYVRILESRVEPGERVPLHVHQWDSIIITLQGARFVIEDCNGNVKEEEWLADVEHSKGDTAATVFSSYTNVDTQSFIALVFEIKH